MRARLGVAATTELNGLLGREVGGAVFEAELDVVFGEQAPDVRLGLGFGLFFSHHHLGHTHATSRAEMTPGVFV